MNNFFNPCSKKIRKRLASFIFIFSDARSAVTARRFFLWVILRSRIYKNLSKFLVIDKFIAT